MNEPHDSHAEPETSLDAGVTEIAEEQPGEAMFALRVGSVWLLLPAILVSGVVAFGPTTRVPRAPEYIIGLLPHGEGCLAVLDTARFLKLESSSPRPTDHGDTGSPRVVIARAGDLEAGLLCDQATGVVHVPTSELEHPPTLDAGRLQEFLHAQVELDATCYGIVDLNELLEAARIRSRREARGD